MADEPAEPADEPTTAVELGVDGETPPAPPKPARSHVQLALIVGTAVVVALAALTGWLGYRAYESRQTAQLQDLLVAVGRQGLST